MAGSGWVALAALAFVGTHFLLSHPLRQPLVAAFGESAFLVIYSLVAGSARGVFTIARHPMMWAFALWGLCHVAVYPVEKNIVVALAIVILALVGAALQDRKKERLQPVLR